MAALAEGLQGRHFAFLCRYGLDLSAPLAWAWWTALTSSDAKECRWVVRKFTTYRGSDEAFCKWIFWAIPPKTLVEATETLCGQGSLSRREATAIQETIFAAMRHADWK